MKISEVPVGAKFRTSRSGMPSMYAYIRVKDKNSYGRVVNARFAFAEAGTRKNLYVRIEDSENCVICG